MSKENIKWEISDPEILNMQAIDYVERFDDSNYEEEWAINYRSNMDIETAIADLENDIFSIDENYHANNLEEAKDSANPLMEIGFYIGHDRFTMLKMADLLPYVRKTIAQTDIEGTVEHYVMFQGLIAGFCDYKMLRFSKYELNNLIRLRDLNNKLSLIPEDKLSVIATTKKLCWKGTPGEFGAIFNLLFDMGYIDIVKDKANMVRVLNEIFEIKNDTGNTVNEKYLYKCFGEKEKKFHPNQLKIPFSDRYNTGK